MKFEIDDKTGMINTEDFGEYWDTAVKGLNAIEQAIEKTKAPLLNEKIQDSKNKIDFYIKDATITFQDSHGNTKTFDKRHIERIEIVDDSKNHYQDFPLAKIEENQKMRARLEKWYEQVLDDLTMIVNEGGKDYEMLTLQNKLSYILTGKDIEELS